MSFNVNKTLKHGLLTLSAVALLSGCGTDDSTVSAQSAAGTETVSEAKVRVAGAAIKGVIQQGLVTANRLVVNEAGHYEIDPLLAKPVRTDVDGRYELRLGGKAQGWAVVELTADADTRMLCDVVPQCDQAGAEPVPFGQSFALSNDFTLRGAGDLASEIIDLTPLSQLAVGVAERSASGLSSEALNAAYQKVENWFGLSAGALRLTPPDLTKLNEAQNASADAMQVAVMNAAFLALVNDSSKWSSIAEVLNDMTSQIATNGKLDILGNGNNLALSDIVAMAALQASELQMTVESSIMSQKLVIVEYRSMQRFKTVADVYSEESANVAETDSGDSADDGTTTDDADGTTDDTVIVDGTDGTTGGTGTDQPPANGGTGEVIPNNTALLSWQAPFTRQNGVSLSMGEIAGYEVGYGLTADTLNQTLAIGDASADELLIDGLSAGNWYFAIRTIDTDGNKSVWSEVVSKAIQI